MFLPDLVWRGLAPNGPTQGSEHSPSATYFKHGIPLYYWASHVPAVIFFSLGKNSTFLVWKLKQNCSEARLAKSQMGGPGAELKGYSHRGSTQGVNWTTALDLTELGQKAAHWKNVSLLIRKSYSFFLGVMVKKGVADANFDDDE